MQNKYEKYKKIWTDYTTEQLDKKSKAKCFETKKHFKNIPDELRIQFAKENKRIIQFGCSDGHFIKNFVNEKSIIGYDYAPTSISENKRNGVVMREIDLNSIKDNQLSYHSELQTDLDIPSNVLMIRVLEYLKPKAAALLLFAFITNAKPGTRLHIDLYADDESAEGANCKDPNETAFHYYLKANYVATFFAPRTDIKFLHHEVDYNPQNEPTEMGAYVERLIVQKL